MTFSFRRLQEITDSKEDSINIDLSVISIDHWETLCEHLVHFGLKKIAVLSFNCNSASKYMRDSLQFKKQKGSKARNLPPYDLEGSVYSQNPDMEADVAALMARILPKTKSIRSLSFHSICFNPVDLDVISQSLSICKSLRTLKFHGIPFHTADFIRLSKALRHKFIINLTMRNCNVSDKVADSFIKLIRCHTAIQKKAEHKAEVEKRPIGIVSISNIDFRDNKFTPTFIAKITSELDASPIFRLDLRDNIRIPGTYPVSPKIVVGITPQIPEKSPSRLTKRGELEIENHKLKRKLDMFDSKNVAEINKRTFAVGDRAGEFATHVNELDRFCKYITKKKKQK
ncbi:hypothetical protein TRFO_19162 [Tritrichomonas foetus]|uniref:Leucine Rich Repeat family protein n=1 Tax=Tritrichomonas foetus TaxID=1144522 RepID=A0A1J4KJN4_9EUKA|nr:hypothetical protein TRFO_19162 [Tritrichomonas foetus]|eukprot:OHT11427.1 hypothetical protein TRFO_19162 [Tritrichomonas foetus]